jgi:hypothetical protein
MAGACLLAIDRRLSQCGVQAEGGGKNDTQANAVGPYAELKEARRVTAGMPCHELANLFIILSQANSTGQTS